mmetsp:Transcript_36192/g.115123  ORF Transcript_36192/g.115123 Transcript_36192/m.115123 type:complete len:524 (+) Transcript_36192:136-1707(+)
MSWFVGEDGQQLWVARDETVYTVVEHEGELPLENLTYLSLQTKKSVYHECIYQEDLLAEGKSRVPRRQREHHSGRQRGFILRAEEESPLSRVVPWFKATAQKLVDDGEVSRVDADEAANLKKKKKDDKEKKAQLNLGANECHVETNARVHHFAHGPGFRVEVMQGNVTQRIHFFTNRKQLSCSEWNALLSEAIESTGNHVMVARRPQNAEAEQGAEGKAGPEGGGLRLRTRTKKSKAQQDDDAWLASMMKMAPAVGSDQESEESEEEEEEGEDAKDGRTEAPGGPQEPKNQQKPAPTQGLPPPPDPARHVERTPSERNRATLSYIQDWRQRDPARRPERGGFVVPPDQDWRQRGAGRGAVDRPTGRPGEPSRRTEQARIERSTYSASQERLEWRPRDSARRPEPRGERAAHPCESDKNWRLQDPARHVEHPRPERNGRPIAHGQDSVQQGPKQAWLPQRPPQRRYEDDVEQRASRVAREKVAKCFECGRGKPLKLFEDDDYDGNLYCRMCWVEFYGLEPPAKK